MGQEQRELVLAMSYAAHQEAHKHLSEAGREALEMMEYTSRHSGVRRPCGLEVCPYLKGTHVFA